jgi:hypothetical protein
VGNIRVFSKMAFLCNMCFLMATLMQFFHFHVQGEMVATIIIIGYLVAFFVNLVANLWALLLWYKKELRNLQIPQWLLYSNLFLLIPEFILLIK